MKKILILLFLINSFCFSEVATKNDIRESTKLLIELIKSNQKATDKRFEDMRRYSDKRFDDMIMAMDKRFEQVDKRFEQVDKRFDMMFNFISLLFFIAVGQFWYLIKDRREIKKDVKEELELQLNLKADVKLVDSIITVLENFARTNKNIANVLKEHKFAVAK